jgi:hypothetical protein
MRDCGPRTGRRSRSVVGASLGPRPRLNRRAGPRSRRTVRRRRQPLDSGVTNVRTAGRLPQADVVLVAGVPVVVVPTVHVILIGVVGLDDDSRRLHHPILRRRRGGSLVIATSRENQNRRRKCKFAITHNDGLYRNLRTKSLFGFDGRAAVSNRSGEPDFGWASSAVGLKTLSGAHQAPEKAA